MSIGGIAQYCLRAGTFAAVVCAAYALICLLRGRVLRLRRLLGIAYLAALLQITVIRGGVDYVAVLRGGREAQQLIPLHTTLEALRQGTWPLIYHVAGNLVWFVPLGWMCARRGVCTALLAGAGLSAAIELMQYLMMTGMTDVDDVLLNASGALLGWLLARGYRCLMARRREENEAEMQ